MLDTVAEEKPDRRPAMLVCMYEESDPAWLLQMLDVSSGTGSAVRIVPFGPDDPEALARALTGQLDDTDCRAVLLVGRTRKADRFRLQMRAENRTLTGGQKLSGTGPALARATAPVAEMVRALGDAGFAADATSDCEEDAGSYLLYRVLTALPDHADAVAVGLLRTPGGLTTEETRRGVAAATMAMARHLTPLPRARFN
jgi:pyrrolidone-carboxylate peptidase